MISLDFINNTICIEIPSQSKPDREHTVSYIYFLNLLQLYNYSKTFQVLLCLSTIISIIQENVIANC